MSCQEAVQYLYAYLDDALEGGDLEALEAHLSICYECCDKLAFNRTVTDVVERLSDVDGVRPEFARRLRDRLKGD